MAKPSKKRLNINATQTKYLLSKLGIDNIEKINITILNQLKENLKELTDSRQKYKTTFKIWDIVICVILADFSDSANEWDDIVDFVEAKYDFLKSFLQMTGGIPSAQTYERVMSLINHYELEKILNNFFFNFFVKAFLNKDILNFDGRVSRNSSRKETEYSKYEVRPLNVLSAYSNNYGICVASEMIDEKSNEIHAIPDLIERLNIKDVIVTWDALNTQKANVKCVIDNFGDYVVPIKGNQGNFYDNLKLYFDDKKLEQIEAGNTQSSYLKEVEKSHSSLITYEYFQTSDINWYFDKDNWADLKTISLVKKTIVQNGNTTIECRYYISSLNVNIREFSNAIRSHWSVENKLHWHLDFTFREDNNRTANKNALMNLQLINKFCLSILEKVKPFYNNISLKRIRNIISLDFEKEFINLICYFMLAS